MEHEKNYKKITLIAIIVILLLGALIAFGFDVYRKNVVFNAPFERPDVYQEEESRTYHIEESDDINGKFDNNSSELKNDSTTLPPATETTTEVISETTTEPKPSLPSDVISDDEDLLIEAINKLRTENGLEKLKSDKSLSDFAAIRSKELQTKLSANRPDGKTFRTIFNEYGIYENLKPIECVAKHKKFDTNAVLKAWLNTEQYKEII